MYLTVSRAGSLSLSLSLSQLHKPKIRRTLARRFLSDRFTEANDRLRDIELDRRKALLEIGQTTLQMELSCGNNHVLARRLNDDLDRRIDLVEQLQALSQDGKLRWVHGLECHAYDRL